MGKIMLMIIEDSWPYYSATLEVFEFIIIEVYGSTVFTVVARLSDGNYQAYDYWL
jgi:hypothetical protein